MSNKKLTCGVVIRIKNTNKFLIEHVTMKKFWSIPKGEADENENSAVAAIRETKEECGLKLDANKLKYIGTFDYNNFKNIALFEYSIDETIDTTKLVCTSYFDFTYTRKSDKQTITVQKPEVDGFCFIDIDKFEKMANKNLYRVVKENIEWN